MTPTLRLLTLAPVLVLFSPPPQQQRAVAIRAMQLAEDSRARDSVSMRPLRDGLRSADTSIQVLALRGIGRFEMPEMIPQLLPLLNSSAPTVRAEAANALAQSATAPGVTAAARSAAALQVFDALRTSAAREQPVAVRAALVRSMSRLQLTLPEQVRVTDSLSALLLRMPGDSAAVVTALLSIERLARVHARVAPISPATVEVLRAMMSGRPPTAISPAPPALARRLAFMTLTATGQMNAALLAQTVADPDPQVRRLTAAALATAQGVEQRERMLNLLLGDSAQIVRLEVVRGWLRRSPATECVPLLRATNDAAINVATGAIDILTQAGTGCPAGERDAILATLVAMASELPASANNSLTLPGRSAMQKGAHAIVALATLAPGSARTLLPAASAHPSWVARTYAARALGTLRDTAALIRLAADQNANVRSTAIEALRRVAGHSSDSVFISGLANSDYNVVRVSAAALAQAPAKDVVTRALLAELARITRERRETSRDARVAVIDRVGELASPSDSAALTGYLRDFDPVIAGRSAQILSRWTGRTISAAPVPLAPADQPPIDNAIAPGTRLRFTMSQAAGGGVFEMEMLSGESPYTATRVVRLARAGYYNGLTFHRVAPNFVLQGGSPGANEYVGDGPFMRDEIWMHTNERGTVGISTRGRDTGDAQIFVNTVDNPRLDFDYTVFARVVTGMQVVDATTEGDVIERVEVIAPRPAAPR